MLNLTELDDATRAHMVSAARAERLGSRPFVPARLTTQGAKAWPDLLERALSTGNDDSLFDALVADAGIIHSTEVYERGGVLRERRINLEQAARLLATSEFNTFYVRGLSQRLLDEGVELVQIYRAATPQREPADCARHEGIIVRTSDVHDGHRARYWPVLNPRAFSVPFHSGCRHSIQRVMGPLA